MLAMLGITGLCICREESSPPGRTAVTEPRNPQTAPFRGPADRPWVERTGTSKEETEKINKPTKPHSILLTAGGKCSEVQRLTAYPPDRHLDHP